MNVVCRVFGHDLDPLFTQPEPQFEKGWNKWLGETIWYEVFDHDCLRCGRNIRVWRWTREASKKMLER